MHACIEQGESRGFSRGQFTQERKKYAGKSVAVNSYLAQLEILW